MKARIVWLIGLTLLLTPVTIFAGAESLSVEDVLRLHFAGVSDEVIISELIVTGSAFVLDVEDILRLTEAGLSDRLVKFMIDTRLEDTGEEVGAEAEYFDESTYESSGEVWVNVIEEEPAETEFIASLNYNYGSWWYDCYWNDYWYYDFHYAPYRSSYCFSLGIWYPTWYSYGYCYSPPYYGYGYHYYGPYWGGYNYYYYDPYYYYDDDHGHYHGGSGDVHHYPSDLKYKKGSSGSGGKVLAGGGGGKLKMGDGSRVTATKQGHLLVDKRQPRGDDVLVADAKTLKPLDVRRPTKSGSTSGNPRVTKSGGTTKVSSLEVTDRPPDRSRRPVRGTRAPATKPTTKKVLRPAGSATGATSKVERPPTPRRPTSSAPKATPKPSKPTVKKAPTKKSSSAPGVAPKPSKPSKTPSRSAVKSSPPRPKPSAGPKRSAPRSSKPTRAPGKRR